MTIDHAAARKLLVRSWDNLLPTRERTLCASQAIQAVSFHETRYSMAWTGPLAGSFNMGALQCAARPDASGKCPPGCAPHGDSHSDGTQYGACFRVYGSAEAGYMDFVRWFASRHDVLDAADSNDLYAFCLAMRKRYYFESRGTTDAERAMNYAKPLETCALEIAMALGEPLCVSIFPTDLAP